MKTNYDFPYYFLDLTSPDISYINTKFEETELVITIDLGENELNQGIDVVLEVENTQTFYRRIFVLSESRSTVKIKYNQLGSKVYYTILLLSKQDGEIELNGETDYYEFGDCVGVLEKNTILFEDSEGFSGLIKIARTNEDDITYDLTSDWITISLPTETYDNFLKWQGDDKNTPIALASLGNSCIQFAIIKALKQPEVFNEKKWWQTIESLLTDKGFSVNHLEEDKVPEATNKILGNCIQGMINTLAPEVDNEDPSNFI
ncbi:MAG: hypothetical protein K9I84_03590 [Leadbetterella sp.]|nr:hypothetical protein [Leadbetterella sp.]